jgi:L-ascorbate oxidase
VSEVGLSLKLSDTLQPRHFFDYELHPTSNETGSYFYHSHVGFQTVSAVGSLIIEDAGEPPYEYDEDRLLMLTEYFNKTDDAIVQGLKANPFVWSASTYRLTNQD